MASSRNLAYTFAKEKYCSDWVLFVEDDVKYSNKWYSSLLQIANSAYGARSPYGLPYSSFSASPHNALLTDHTVYDPKMMLGFVLWFKSRSKAL